MTSEARKLLDEALTLSKKERLELIAALSDSLDPEPVELSSQWRAEVDDRIGQLERGEVKPVPFDEVEARIRATLGTK